MFVGPNAAAILQTVVIEAVFLIASFRHEELSAVRIAASIQQMLLAVPDICGDSASIL